MAKASSEEISATTEEVSATINQVAQDAEEKQNESIFRCFWSVSTIIKSSSIGTK